MKIQIKTNSNGRYIENYVTLYSDVSETINNFIFDYNNYIQMLVRDKNITIIYERIYATKDNIRTFKKKRYENQNRLPSPNYLINHRTETSVQLYYVVGNLKAETIRYNGKEYGIQVEANGIIFLYIMGLYQKDRSKLMTTFKELVELLKNKNMNMRNVFRTWFWLEHILDWYDDFNQVRNTFYVEQGILGDTNNLPASTGIGIDSVGGFGLLDVFACNNIDCFAFSESSNCQNSAYDYGSAFSREVTVNTYSGRTCFISGTAAIDKEGITTNIGNIDGQIHDTMANLQSILSTKNGRVLATTVYCKNKEVEERFSNLYGYLDWNYVIVIADVCRDNLLFEIEMVVSVDG